MAQHDYVIANGTGAAVRSDLNNALAAIVSQNSGATAPATTYAFQFWADTTTGLLKLRNSSNNAWVTLFQLDGEWSTLPVENGTAAAPSIYFKDSGTDTGFYSPGTDQVAISTAGTGRLFINSSGSVGIGTSSPGAPLNVVQSGNGNIATFNNGTVSASVFVGGSAITFGDTAGNNQAYILPGSNAYTLYTAGSERLRIDSSGRVGIGTTSPAVNFHINSPSANGEQWIASGTGFASSLFLKANGSGGGLALSSATDSSASVTNTLNAALTFGTNNTERARIDSSGRWLLGTSTTATTCRSVIQGNSAGSGGTALLYLAIDSSSPTDGTRLGSLRFSDNRHSSVNIDGSFAAEIAATRDGGTWTSGTSQPTRLVFSTTADGASSPTERMRISNNGVIDCFVSGGEGFALHSAQSAGNSLNFFVGYYGATGINGTASYIVRTNGNVLNTNGSYTAISDQKLKENIVDANSQWNDLKAIKIRNWNFKEETGHETHRQIGPIAQELEQVCPGLVFEVPEHNLGGEAVKGVNQSVLYMKAVKALQEAMERIEQLEAKVAALESA